MISSNTYSITWLQALLLTCLLALVLPAQAVTEAASVLFSHGNVVLTNDTGSYPLEKGAAVSAGDTVITGEDGRIQMRFSDGGLVSLMPNSRFAVEEYSQPTASSEGSASVNLLKGGMRALSGSIGKKDQDSYKLKTDVATLGIRGTQFVVVMDGAAMRVHVGQGSVSLFNDFGELLVPAGMHAEVFPGQAPVISTTAPVFMSANKPILQDSEEQQREANQSPATTNQTFATDVMRTLDPFIISSEKNGGGNGSQQVPSIPNTETYDGGFAFAVVGQTDTNDPGNPQNPINSYELNAPDVNVLSVETLTMLGIQDSPESLFDGTSGYTALPQQALNDAVQTAGGLTWTEWKVEQPSTGGGPEVYAYQAYIWGDSVTNMPISGTLSYSLSQGANATPVRNGNILFDDSTALSRFDMQIELGQTTKFTVDVEAQGSGGWAIENLNTPVNGSLNKNSGEFHFAVGDGALGCGDCVFKAGGFLSGEAAAQAGVVYHYHDNDGQHHTGGVVLDRHIP